MVLFITALAIGWFCVLYLICRAYINFINKRNTLTSTRRQVNVQSIVFNKVLTIASAVGFIVIMIVFKNWAIDFITPIVEEDKFFFFVLGASLRAMFFVFGFWFAPGSIASIVYVVYLRQRLLGQPKSYVAETITILAAGYTFFAHEIIQHI